MSVGNVSGNYGNYGAGFSASSKNAGGEAQVKDESAQANVAAQNAQTEAALLKSSDALSVYGQAFISKAESFGTKYDNVKSWEEAVKIAESSLGADAVSRIGAEMEALDVFTKVANEEFGGILSDGAQAFLSESYTA